MDQQRMAAAIKILNVGTYMTNLRYLVVASEITHLVAYKISEGLLLAVDGHPTFGLENLVVNVSETVKQVKEIIPEGTEIIFLGDGEFDGIELQAKIFVLNLVYTEIQDKPSICAVVIVTLGCEL